MSNLQSHAEYELRRVGLFDEDGAYGGMLGPAALALVKLFSEQGHSGMSASFIVGIFEKLARFQPLSPLTGDDDEWMEIDNGLYQNRRCSRVFKKDGHAYDIEGRIFREPSGSCFTGADSHTPVEFPYTPHSEYVDVLQSER